MVRNEFVDDCRRVLNEVRDFFSHVSEGIGADYISEHFEEERDFRKIVFPAGVMLALVAFVTSFVYGSFGSGVDAGLQKGIQSLIETFVKFVVYYYASLFVFDRIVCRTFFKLEDANRKARAFTVIVMLFYFAIAAVMAVFPFLDVLRFLSLYLVYLAYCVADDYFGVQVKRIVLFLVCIVGFYSAVLFIVGKMMKLIYM